MASLWNLPVLFICENNHYQIGTEIHRHSAVAEVYKRASAYHIPARRIDGMDVMSVYQSCKEALEQIRAGNGPQLIECETYRFRGHSMADPGTYRPKVELQAYENTEDPLKIAIAETVQQYPSAEQMSAIGKDNIIQLTGHMHANGLIDAAQLQAMQARAEKVVEESVRFASNSPDPTMADAEAALNCNRGEEVLL